MTGYRDFPAWQAAQQDYVTDWYARGVSASETFMRRDAAIDRMFDIESAYERGVFDARRAHGREAAA